jgi:hypothetical protein
VADEYAGCHRCLDVFRLARCQTERNRVFDLGCRCYGVLSRGAVDVGEAAGTDLPTTSLFIRISG